MPAITRRLALAAPAALALVPHAAPAAVNGGRGEEGRAPWLILRLRPLAPGRVGR